MQEPHETAKKSKKLANQNTPPAHSKNHNAKNVSERGASKPNNSGDVNPYKVSPTKPVPRSTEQNFVFISTPETLHKLRTNCIKSATAEPQPVKKRAAPQFVKKRNDLNSAGKSLLKSTSASIPTSGNGTFPKLEKSRPSQVTKKHKEPELLSLDRGISQGMVDFGFALTNPKLAINTNVFEVDTDSQEQDKLLPCNLLIADKEPEGKLNCSCIESAHTEVTNLGCRTKITVGNGGTDKKKKSSAHPAQTILKNVMTADNSSRLANPRTKTPKARTCYDLQELNVCQYSPYDDLIVPEVFKPQISNTKDIEPTGSVVSKQNTQLKKKKDRLPKTKTTKCLVSTRLKGKNSRKAKHLDVPSSVAELLANRGSKTESNLYSKTLAEDYLLTHRLVIVYLIQVIDQIDDITIFTSAVECIYDLLITSHLLDVHEPFNAMDYIKRSDYTTLLNTFCTMRRRLDGKKFQKLATYLFGKLLKIICFFCKYKKCRAEVLRVNTDVLMFLYYLPQEHPNREIIFTSMYLFKIICRKKRNRKFLNNKDFYNSLYISYEVIQTLGPIIEILKLMAKDRCAIISMSSEENVIKLLVDYVTYINNNKPPFCRCGVAGILQTIACTEDGIILLRKHDSYTRLYNFFLLCQRKQEHHCRMKVYSILNRFRKLSVLPITVLPLSLGLPDHMRRTCESIIDLADEDFESEESSEDSTDSDETTNQLMNIIKEPRNTRIDTSPVFNMRKYFLEYFTDNSETFHLSFRLFENYMPHDTRSVFRQVIRSSHLSGLAFPDAAMLPPLSDHYVVETVECPVDYLSKRLTDMYTTTRSEKIVFDLDNLILKYVKPVIPRPHTYAPKLHAEIVSDSLHFESRFESGNLRKATQVDTYEYNLEVNPDTSTIKGYNWFYFQVSNMQPAIPYTFNIINLTADEIMYNEGMRPVWFSTIKCTLHGTGWRRTTGRVVIFGNSYTNKCGRIQYRTLTFSIVFPFVGDYVYIAHHFPYTYSRLMVNLAPLTNFHSTRIYARLDKLCETVNSANEVPLLTITASTHHSESAYIPLDKRPIIILTARVHPGEANASWVMEGMINHLLDEGNKDAAKVRENFIFKVIPMLNVEGVIYGNGRHGLIGKDLNRTWANPDIANEPEIFYVKKLVEYAKRRLASPVSIFMDVHGHSQRKFFFLFGCNPKLSWKSEDRKRGNWHETLQVLPKIIQQLNPHMALSQCWNRITLAREKTARVVMWREFNIAHSYTFECSLSEGHKRQSMNPLVLTEVGRSVIDAFGKLPDLAGRSLQSASFFGRNSRNLKHRNK